MSESNSDLKVLATGATRSKDADATRYDLISPIALEGVARIYAEGAETHGEKNWENGMSIEECANHGIRHWNLYASGDRSEDHLSKCIWNWMGAKHSEVAWPDLNLGLRRGDCVAPTVSDETAAERARLRANLARMTEDLKRASEGDSTEKRLEVCRRCHQTTRCDNGGDGLDYGYPCVVDRDHEKALRAAEDREDDRVEAADPWEGEGAYLDGDGTVRFRADDSASGGEAVQHCQAVDGVAIREGTRTGDIREGMILDPGGKVIGYDTDRLDLSGYRELFVVRDGVARTLKTRREAASVR